MPEDEFPEYRRLILAELGRLSDEQKATRDEIGDMRVDIGQLRVYASLWGAFWGAIVSLVTVIIGSMIGRKQ